jgi:hypothetical protein
MLKRLLASWTVRQRPRSAQVKQTNVRLATFDTAIFFRTKCFWLCKSESISLNKRIQLEGHSLIYLRKHPAKVLSLQISPPLPFNSKLMSNIGSTVLVTLPQR